MNFIESTTKQWGTIEAEIWITFLRIDNELKVIMYIDKSKGRWATYHWLAVLGKRHGDGLFAHVEEGPYDVTLDGTGPVFGELLVDGLLALGARVAPRKGVCKFRIFIIS